MTLSTLTKREMEVLCWVALGKSNWEIGQILDCETGTVKKHMQRIFAKLGVESRMAAANYLRGPLTLEQLLVQVP